MWKGNTFGQLLWLSPHLNWFSMIFQINKLFSFFFFLVWRQIFKWINELKIKKTLTPHLGGPIFKSWKFLTFGTHGHFNFYIKRKDILIFVDGERVIEALNEQLRLADFNFGGAVYKTCEISLSIDCKDFIARPMRYFEVFENGISCGYFYSISWMIKAWKTYVKLVTIYWGFIILLHAFRCIFGLGLNRE